MDSRIQFPIEDRELCFFDHKPYCFQNNIRLPGGRFSPCREVTPTWSICNCMFCLRKCLEHKTPWGFMWRPRQEPELPVVWMKDSHVLYALSMMSRDRAMDFVINPQSSRSRDVSAGREFSYSMVNYTLRSNLLIDEITRRGMLPTEKHLFMAFEQAMNNGVEIHKTDFISVWAKWDPRWSQNGRIQIQTNPFGITG